MILPGGSQKILANVPLSIRELRNTPPKKSDFIFVVVVFLSFFLSSFLPSHTKLLTSIAYKTKAVIELIYTQNDIAFVIVAPFSPFVCNWQEWWFWLATVLRSSNTMPFLATHKRSRFRRVPIVHAQFTCKHILLLRWLCSRCLPNPCESNIWWRMTTRRKNLYLSVSTITAIVEMWLPFMTCRICILRTLHSG